MFGLVGGREDESGDVRARVQGVVIFTDVLWVVVGLDKEGEGDWGWVGGFAFAKDGHVNRRCDGLKPAPDQSRSTAEKQDENMGLFS